VHNVVVVLSKAGSLRIVITIASLTPPLLALTGAPVRRLPLHTIRLVILSLLAIDSVMAEAMLAIACLTPIALALRSALVTGLTLHRVQLVVLSILTIAYLMAEAVLAIARLTPPVLAL